jgi:dTDP-4-dehydrorhamnose 3,5-epimerase-like enzyme
VARLPNVKDCLKLQIPKMEDPRGNLSFVENNRHVPFDIKRIFYIYDVPTGESRGAHTHQTLEQVLICLSGSFDVEIDDGQSQKTIHLNRPWEGLYIPPMIWAAEKRFDSGTVYLVLCSGEYDSEDYLRDYVDFSKRRREALAS